MTELKKRSNLKFVIAGLLVSIVIAFFISPFASSDPDGLEKVAHDKGFMEQAEGEGATVWDKSPISDYEVPSIRNNFLSKGVAGLLGTAIIFVMGLLAGKILSKKANKKGGSEQMNVKKIILMMLVVSVAVLGVRLTGHCHQPEIKEKGELTFSGYLSAAFEYEKVDYDGTATDEYESDISVDELGLAFSAGLTKDITADALILYEEEEDDTLVTIDEAYLSMICPTTEMCFAHFGKMYIPFADAETSFVSDPFTHDLGETRESVLSIGVRVSMIDFEIGTFNGDSDKAADDNNNVDDFYASLLVTPVEGDALTVKISAAYLSDITDTDATILDDGNPATDDSYTDRTGAYSFWISAEAELGSLLIEYVAAEDDMTKDLAGAKPEALNVELVGTFVEDLEIGLKYEATDEFTTLVAGGDSEITRLGLLVGYELNEKAEVALEYITAEDDLTNNKVDTIIAQLELEF